MLRAHGFVMTSPVEVMRDSDGGGEGKVPQAFFDADTSGFSCIVEIGCVVGRCPTDVVREEY